MPAKKIVQPLAATLLVVGLVAALVYGMCSLMSRQLSVRVPDPSIGKVMPYEAWPKPGEPRIAYVSATFQWVSWVSSYAAIICIGILLTYLIAFVWLDFARLLFPARFEGANLELKRYRATVGPAGTTAEGLRFVEAWRDRGRRLSVAAGPMITLPGVLLFNWLLAPDDRVGRPFFWFMGLGLIVTIAGCIWASLFRCPRCNELYSQGSYVEFTLQFCTNCGLPVDSTSTTAVADGFAEWQQTNR